MREIGSEFWKNENQHILPDETIYLSGRTALDIIVKDAIERYGIESALLPSYCCHTMIEPFFCNGVAVRFYDVYINEENFLVADIPAPSEKEILYIMKYFGDTDLYYEGIGKSLIGWVASIEDLTHSCFAEGYLSKADYWFTSYRKWFAVDGIAIAGKRRGKLPEAKKCNDEFSRLRNKAFTLKQQFMTGASIAKKDFLEIFRQAEQLLEEDYQAYGAGAETIYELFQFIDEIDHIQCKRRNNANTLLKGLSNINGIKVFADFSEKTKCPLFVPVIVGDHRRDALRKYLISKDIYCPIHWPISEAHRGISKRAALIYSEELSLACDQRYDELDMERTVKEIQIFMANG